MGGVYKTRKDKYRIVADATRTGVNASMTRPKVQLDTLDDVVRDSFAGGWQVGIDLSECFLLYMSCALDGDLFTLQDTREERRERSKVWQ